MRDKMIRDRRKSGESVGASVDTHLEAVVGPLEESLAEHLEEGETLPDFGTVLLILQRILAAALQKLLAAGAQHLWELDNDVKLRQRRDAAVGRLGASVARFRNTLDGVFGPGSALQLAGLDGRTEQEPVALQAQVERILERFADPEAELASPGFGVEMDRAAVLEDFLPDYEELRDLLADLRRENRKSDATLIAKQEALAHYDRVFRWIASGLESFYHLAGQHELAERVKPSTRRPGRTQTDAEAEAPDESPAPDEEDAPDTPSEADESETGG